MAVARSSDTGKGFVFKGVMNRLTWLDRLLVLGVGLLVAGSFTLLQAGSAGQRVVVERDGKVVFNGVLTEARRVTVNGPLGPTVIAIKDGSVCVLSSPCPAKVCIRTGQINRQGELLACVPNHLVIRVEGTPDVENDYDLISR